MSRIRVPMALVAGLAGLAIVGCGSDSDDDSTAASTTTSAGATTTIEMGDYFFSPKDATGQPGSTIDAPNSGAVEHELVLFRSDADPASLPVKGGEVDEAAVEKSGSVVVGEIEEVAPGESKRATFKLTPGRYVMICNLPGHYERGMYGTVTVK